MWSGGGRDEITWTGTLRTQNLISNGFVSDSITTPLITTDYLKVIDDAVVGGFYYINDFGLGFYKTSTGQYYSLVQISTPTSMSIGNNSMTINIHALNAGSLVAATGMTSAVNGLNVSAGGTGDKYVTGVSGIGASVAYGYDLNTGDVKADSYTINGGAQFTNDSFYTSYYDTKLKTWNGSAVQTNLTINATTGALTALGDYSSTNGSISLTNGNITSTNGTITGNMLKGSNLYTSGNIPFHSSSGFLTDTNLYVDYGSTGTVHATYFQPVTNYKSTDGTTGLTSTCTVKVSGVDKTMTIKNGIITSIA